MMPKKSKKKIALLLFNRFLYEKDVKAGEKREILLDCFLLFIYLFICLYVFFKF